MKTIRRFSNVAQAGFARSLLEAAGIHATLADEHAYTMGPQYAPWGIRLQVPEADSAQALRVLDEQEGFAALPDDFVPPPEVVPITATTVHSEAGISSAFLRGGFWALGLFGILAVVSVAAGGRAHADVGGILLLFLLGGITGLIVRAIYNKGRRDQLGSARTD